MGTLANSGDPDEMQHYVAFHLGLHCLLKLKPHSWTDMNHNLENCACNTLKYIMGYPIISVSICMGKSIRIRRVKGHGRSPVPSKCEQAYTGIIFTLNIIRENIPLTKSDEKL